MNNKSKITLIAAVLTTLAAPAFAEVVVPEFPGELAQPTVSFDAQRAYASTQRRAVPIQRVWMPTRAMDEQRYFDRGSSVID